jgi:hypothetical protein
MHTCDHCKQPIEAGEPARTFVWLGGAMNPYSTEHKPDLRVHERCLPSWKRPDPYYHDTRDPFPDTGM